MKCGFSRADCDANALASQQRAAAAQDAQRLRSVFPVFAENGSTLLAADETPRCSTTAASLARLPAAIAEMGAKYRLDAVLCKHHGVDQFEHVHRAGNSPTMAEGASAVLLASDIALRRHELRPRARILAMADVSIDRTLALTGAVDATRRALARRAQRRGHQSVRGQ